MLMIGFDSESAILRGFRKLTLLVGISMAFGWAGISVGQAQAPIEDQLRAIADSFPTPRDTPSIVIEEMTAEGRTLKRVLRIKAAGLKASADSASPELMANFRKSQQATHIRALCRNPGVLQLLKSGAVFNDQILFFDHSPFVTIRTDAAACRSLKKGFDFSGADRVAPSTPERIRTMAEKMKTPLKMPIGAITEVRADGVWLRRRVVLNFQASKAQFDGANQAAMIRQQCQNAFLAQVIKDGGKFEDTVVSSQGEVLAVVVTDRAACHRVTQ